MVGYDYTLEDSQVSYSTGLTYRSAVVDESKLEEALSDSLRMVEHGYALYVDCLLYTSQDPATGVQNPPEGPAGLSGENGTAETTAVPSDPVEEKLQEVSDSETAEAQPVSGEGTDGETGDPAGQEPGVEEVPPCPWEIRYYPDLDAAELVEVLLRP